MFVLLQRRLIPLPLPFSSVLTAPQLRVNPLVPILHDVVEGFEL